MRFLEMHGISKAYPGVQALRDVSISVDRGEAVALLGENGAGKSTLMNVLGGIVRCDTGEIRIDGRSGYPQRSRCAAARYCIYPSGIIAL